jgi:tetratricopeptide (TPR) repeat protein
MGGCQATEFRIGLIGSDPCVGGNHKPGCYLEALRLGGDTPHERGRPHLAGILLLEAALMPRILFLLIGFAVLIHLPVAAQRDADAQDEAIPSRLQRAQQLLAEQKPQLAIQEYRAILLIRPENLEAQANLGIVLFFQGQCSEAIGHLDQALKVKPGLPKIQALLGVCQKREGHIEEAQKNLEAALPSIRETQISALVEKNLADLYYAEGNLQPASLMMEKLLETDPHNPDVLYMLYRIHLDIANRARDALATLAPDSPRMHQLMAEHFINEGDAENAITQYEAALRGDPQLPGLHYELAEAILQQSKSAESLARATELLKAALAEDPRNAGAEAKLGEVAMLENHRDLAKEDFSHALALRADELNALVGMADIATDQGNNEEAVKYLLQASRQDPMDDRLHYRLSRAYRSLGRKEDSDRELDLFMKIRALKKKTALVEQRTSSP